MQNEVLRLHLRFKHNSLNNQGGIMMEQLAAASPVPAGRVVITNKFDTQKSHKQKQKRWHGGTNGDQGEGEGEGEGEEVAGPRRCSFSNSNLNYRGYNYNYREGDMVWGKVKSHPWWPGQIFNPAFASVSARRARRSGHVLVAFFGDATFGWFTHANLSPFELCFQRRRSQSSGRSFLDAVDDSLDEVARRAALGLMCNCILDRFNSNVNVNANANADTRYVKLTIPGYDGAVMYPEWVVQQSRQNFRPSQLLAFLRAMAAEPLLCGHGGKQQLETIKAVAQLRAYRNHAVAAPLTPSYCLALHIPDEDASMPVTKNLNEHGFEGYVCEKKSRAEDDASDKEDRFLFKRRDDVSIGTGSSFGSRTETVSIKRHMRLSQEGPDIVDVSKFVFQKRSNLKQTLREGTGWQKLQRKQAKTTPAFQHDEKNVIMENFSKKKACVQDPSDVIAESGNAELTSHLIHTKVSGSTISEEKNSFSKKKDQASALKILKPKSNQAFVSGTMSDSRQQSFAPDEGPATVSSLDAQETLINVNTLSSVSPQQNEVERVTFEQELSGHADATGLGVMEALPSGPDTLYVSCDDSVLMLEHEHKSYKSTDTKDTSAEQVKRKTGEEYNVPSHNDPEGCMTIDFDRSLVTSCSDCQLEQFGMTCSKLPSKISASDNMSILAYELPEVDINERKSSESFVRISQDFDENCGVLLQNISQSCSETSHAEIIENANSVKQEMQDNLDTSIVCADVRGSHFEDGSQDVDCKDECLTNTFDAVEACCTVQKSVKSSFESSASQQISENFLLPPEDSFNGIDSSCQKVSSSKIKDLSIREVVPESAIYCVNSGGLQMKDLHKEEEILLPLASESDNKSNNITALIKNVELRTNSSTSLVSTSKIVNKGRQMNKVVIPRKGSKKRKIDSLESSKKPKESGRSEIASSRKHSKVVIDGDSKPPKKLKAKQLRKEPEEPMALSMKFPRNFALPSAAQLKARFIRFGQLDVSGTRIYFHTSSAQVVFRYTSDAEAAYEYATQNSLFGQADIKFRLKKIHQRSVESAAKLSDLEFAKNNTAVLDTNIEHSRNEKSLDSRRTASICTKLDIEDYSTIKPDIGSEELVSLVRTSDRFNVEVDSEYPATSHDIPLASQVVQLKSCLRKPEETGNRATKDSANVKFLLSEENDDIDHLYHTKTKLLKAVDTNDSSDISYQMLQLLRKCSDIIDGVRSSVGFVPYYNFV